MTETVSGNISSFLGSKKPVAGVNVKIFEAGNLLTTVKTDAKGNYTSPALTVGNDYTIQPLLGGYSFEPPTISYHPFSGSLTADFQAHTNSISGTAQNVADLSNLGNAHILISGKLTGGKETDLRTTAETTGAYSFGDVITGENYSLTADLNGYKALNSPVGPFEYDGTKVVDFYFTKEGDKTAAEVAHWVLEGVGVTVSSGAAVFIAFLYKRLKRLRQELDDNVTVEDIINEMEDEGYLPEGYAEGSEILQDLADKPFKQLTEFERSAFDEEVLDGRTLKRATDTVDELADIKDPQEFLKALNNVDQDIKFDVQEQILEDQETFKDVMQDVKDFLDENNVITRQPTKMSEGDAFTSADSLEEINDMEMEAFDAGDGFGLDGEALADVMELEGAEGLVEFTDILLALLDAFMSLFG